MPANSYPTLPLSSLHDAFLAALGQGSLLLEAEPGAGKSTLAPLWVLDALDGEVWLVQPRVLAAISVAKRLAALLGEQTGEQVGYLVPFNAQVSQRTRLTVMTPGVLLQRLLADPALQGVSAVLLDEIHERHVDQDVAWAWLQEAAVFNDELALVLMSATPDAALRKQVDKALYAPGRCFPVDVSYCPAETSNRRRPEGIEQQVLRALREVDAWQQQTVLVFLPGWRQIMACQQALQATFPAVAVHRLHSRVPAAEQSQALNPHQGARVILATNIAETSLTIADVTLVIDSGLVREAELVQKTGVTQLHTRRIAQASAAQRRGRAGRVQAGHCVRLWAESEVLAPQTLPAIRRSDYLPLALRLAHWGTPAEQLPWLEAPNPRALAHANKLLQRWQLLDDKTLITAKGKQVARLGTHPRIAALLLHGSQQPAWWLACLALHFDLPIAVSLDDWLDAAAKTYQQQPRWRKMARRWCKVLRASVLTDKLSTAAQLQLQPTESANLAACFVDRLAQHSGQGQYRLNSGISVALDMRSDWALLLQLRRRGQGHEGVGVPIEMSAEQLQHLAAPQRQLQHQGQGKRARWLWHTQYLLGGQCVDEQQTAVPEQELAATLAAYLKAQGLAQIPWPSAALDLLLRARWAAKQNRMDLPPVDIGTLTQQLDSWLTPFLNAACTPKHWPLYDGLAFYLGFDIQRQLENIMPTQLTLPSERVVKVDYQSDAATQNLISGDTLPLPTISGKLQEFFGATQVAPDAMPLQIQLLSPAGHPLAITRDLAYFWREVYPQVRREMRGRYVKHPWPEDPLSHAPTRKTKRALRSTE